MANTRHSTNHIIYSGGMTMKPLKTMLAMIATLAVCVGIFSGCQASNPTPQSGDAPTTTVAATTTTEMTTTTEATTTTTEPAVVYTINENRLAEIGKTFAEIKELYGDSPIGWNYNGGKIYAFEEAGCSYYFGVQDDRSVPPAEDAICQTIYRMYLHQLFNGLTETVSDTEFAEMYDLEHLWSEQKEFYNKDYMCKFLYGEYVILIHANENHQIGPDVVVEYVEIANE